MRGTVVGVHHGGGRLRIITGLPGNRVSVVGVGGHRKTMMAGAVQMSVMVLVRGKLAGVIDVMLRLVG